MTTIATKDDVLKTLSAERAQWEALLAEIGPERMTEPGVVGDWTVKDLLGHVTAYHRRWGAQLRAEVTGIPPTLHDLYDIDAFPDGAADWTLDEQNAAIRAHYAPFSLPDVLARWRAASDLLTAAVAALPEEDFTTPNRFPWSGADPLITALCGDTYAHAAHHAAEIRAWLDRPRT